MTKTRRVRRTSQTIEVTATRHADLIRAEKEILRLIDHATETLCRLINSDPSALSHYLRIAGRAIEKAVDCPQVQGEVWTVEKAEVYLCADNIKVVIEGIIGDQESDSFGYLIGHCFVAIGIGLVNWDEVASHYLTKYRESKAN